ncbi:MAG: response regulator, partial [Bacteroidetes bacterium]|nr:response regulator [Bacteroidota bacterium]
DKGTCFTIVLPNIESSDQIPDSESAFIWDDELMHFDEALVMVVDDIRYNRELIKSFLASSSLQVIEASDGIECLELVKVHKPDLILMDLRMPGISGYETTRRLHKIFKKKELPVVAFTASSMKHDEGLIHELFHDYLRKPVGRNELMRCLAKFLSHRVSKQMAEPEVDSQRIKALSKEQCSGFIYYFDKSLKNDFEAMKSAFDAELLQNFLNQFVELVKQFSMTQFDTNVAGFKKALETFDFELFEINVRQMEKHISEIRKNLESYG